jgi:protein arginine N-methyltransferase 1
VSRRLSPAAVQDLLLMHQTLLADARRHRAFRQALARTVRPGCAVLDIGSGSGVWAIEAARLGAGRVVAVERERMLVPVIERLARENGVADRVEVIAGESSRLALPRAFDVVVAELVGHQGFNEKLLPVMADARRRFLRPGGHLVPRGLALAGAPARLRGRSAPLNGLRLGAFAELAVHCARVVLPGDLRTLAPAVTLARLDLRRVAAADRPPPLRGRWRVRDLRAVQGIATWVEMTLAPGVHLSTRAGTHWLPTFFPVGDLGRGPGRLACRIALAPALEWEVRVATPGASRVWRHSPLFAYGSLRPARVRPAGRRRTAIRSGA